MDFMTRLPRGKKGNDAIWVVVDRLTKSALFLLMKMTDLVDKLAKLYIDEVIRLHGVPISIISDRDPRFTSRLWPNLQWAMGTKLNLSTTFHPQMDGQSKRTIQTLEDLLRSRVLLEGIERISCHWWSLLIIIAIKLLLVWLHMKHCMGRNVVRQFVGRKWEKGSFWDLKWCN